MPKCEECLHFDVCDAFENGNGIKKIYPTQCGCYKAAADVVEVIRCKDCKYATFYTCKNDRCYNRIICDYEVGTGDENFFCSYGERKEEE